MRYLFTPYELHTEHHDLLYAGVPVKVEPQVFLLLQYLVERHGSFVSRDTLHAHLWPRHLRTDGALMTCMATARKAIQDTGHTQRKIETVYGKGYKFIAPVQEYASMASAQPVAPIFLPLLPVARLPAEAWQQMRNGWLMALMHGDLAVTDLLSVQCLVLAEREQESVPLWDAHRMRGTHFLFTGDFVQGSMHLEQASQLFVLAEHRTTLLRWSGWLLWFLGFPDQAMARIVTAQRLAEECQHPLCLGYAYIFTTILHTFRGEYQAATESALLAQRVVSQHALHFLAAYNAILHTASLVALGDRAQGVAPLCEAITAYQSMGAGLGLSMFFALLAQAALRAGDVTQSRAALVAARAHMEKTGERFYSAELCRVEGELFRHEHDAVRAEAYFQQAIAIAQKQQAKAWELRATVSLAQLWQEQGKAEAARVVLQECYDEWTEGFTTEDMREAQRVLAV